MLGNNSSSFIWRKVIKSALVVKKLFGVKLNSENGVVFVFKSRHSFSKDFISVGHRDIVLIFEIFKFVEIGNLKS